ncbi:phosphate starvation-inducible protein [Pseudoalteromonas phage PH357]|nr:phosphate starvation-inducible protein [Pseudoalteromonas phage PH357]
MGKADSKILEDMGVPLEEIPECKKRNRKSVSQAREAKKRHLGRDTIKKEKHVQGRRDQVIPLTAKSDNQRKALKAFTEKQLVLLSGSAGSGKSELACWWASKLYLEGKIDNIIITRPHKHLGEDYGAVKGNDAEKLLPFCMSMLMKFKKYLGVGILRSDFKLDGFDTLFAEANGIQIVPIEKIQGLSFDERTIVIADEIQGATVAQVKALATRCELGSQLIICGDGIQSPLKGLNGIQYLESVFNDHPHELIEVVKFTPKDNCREGVTRHLTDIFEQDGQW